MNHPELACYIAIREPEGVTQYGGVVAAPLVKQLLIESISITKMEKQTGGIPIDSRWYIDDFYYEVDNYIGKKVSTILMHPHYKIKIIGDGDIIVSQNPKAGEMIVQDNYVYLYTN